MNDRRYTIWVKTRRGETWRAVRTGLKVEDAARIEKEMRRTNEFVAAEQDIDYPGDLECDCEQCLTGWMDRINKA